MKIKEKIKKFVDNPTFLKICKFLCVLSFGVIIGVLSMCDCKKVNADSVSFSRSSYNYTPFARCVNTLAYYNGSAWVDYGFSLPLTLRDTIPDFNYYGDYFSDYSFGQIDNSTRNQYFNNITIENYNNIGNGVVFYSCYCAEPFCVPYFNSTDTYSNKVYFNFETSSQESELVVVQVSYEYYNGSSWNYYEEYFLPTSDLPITNYNFTQSIENPTYSYNGEEINYVSVLRNFDLAYGLQYQPYDQAFFDIYIGYPIQNMSLYDYDVMNNYFLSLLHQNPSSMLGTLIQNVSSFMAIEILPGVTFLGLLGICIAIPLTLMVLKIWLGG